MRSGPRLRRRGTRFVHFRFAQDVPARHIEGERRNRQVAAGNRTWKRLRPGSLGRRSDVTGVVNGARTEAVDISRAATLGACATRALRASSHVTRR